VPIASITNKIVYSALVGFLLALTPLCMQLMDWRGTGGAGVGSAGIGSYFFFGGLLMILGAVGEFILGNTFPFVVFGSFGKSLYMYISGALTC
jgi:succinate-acetate transporter protein